MGGHSLTPQAGRVALEEAAIRPYGEAVAHLCQHHEIRLGKELLEQVTTLVGRFWVAEDQAEIVAFGRNHEPPTAEVVDVKRCVVFADGVMVHADGAWHEARVGTVRSDLADGTERKSSTVRLGPLEEFGPELWRKAWRMGYGEASLRAFVADGSHWLWGLATERFPGAVQVLDYWHMSEHIGQCAAVWFGEGTAEAKSWRDAVCGHLWEGRPDSAFSAVEQLSSRSPARREAKHALITYLTNNRQRMDYPRYRTLGLPCGSGEVEAQCKTLVQARCKQAGMRWSRAGVEALLRVRSAVKDGSFGGRFGHGPPHLLTWRASRPKCAA